MNIFPGIFISAVAVIIGINAEDVTKKVAAFIGGTIKLKCPEVKEGGSFEWRDTVYNDDHGPIMIYNSETGSNTNHTNLDNINISVEKELVLTRLRQDGAGDYICTVTRDDNSTETWTYRLSLYGTPVCEGDGNVVEGTEVELSCSVGIVGELPNLAWRTPRGEIQSKDDLDDPFRAVRMTTVKASHLDDGYSYTCVMELIHDGEKMAQSCAVNFTVRYAAREPGVDPDQEEYSPGDVLRFSALGNPAPNLTLEPTGDQQTGGAILVTITEEMMGKNYTYILSAQNELSKAPVTFSKVFRVVERKATAEGSGSGASAVVLLMQHSSLLLATVILVLKILVL